MNCTMNCIIKVEHFSQICVYINGYIISLFNSKYCHNTVLFYMMCLWFKNLIFFSVFSILL